MQNRSSPRKGITDWVKSSRPQRMRDNAERAKLDPNRMIMSKLGTVDPGGNNHKSRKIK